MERFRQLLVIFLLVWVRPGDSQTLTNNMDSLLNVLSTSTDSEKSSILLQIGFEYSYSDSFAIGLAYLNQALALAEHYKQYDIIAKTNFHLGDLYFQYDDFSNAQICFTRCYNLSIQHKFRKMLVYSSNGLGNVFMVLQDWPNANHYLNKALSIAKKEGLDEDIPKLLNQLGNLHSNQDNHDSALFFYKQLMTAGVSLNDSIMIGYAYTNIASVRTAEGKHEEAIALLERALKIKAIKSKPKVESTIYLNLGQAPFMLQRPELSLDCLHKGYSIAQKQGYLAIQSSCCKVISDVYLFIGEYKMSLEFFKEYSTLRDSVFNIEKQQQSLKFEIKNQMEQSEKQVTIYKQKAMIRNLMLILSLFSMMLLIIIFVQTYRKFRSKIKNQEREQSEMIVTIDQQNRDLVLLAMNLNKKQQLISDLNNTTISISNYPENKELQNYITNISEKIKGENFLDNKWDLFLKHFQGVHPSFYQKLKEKHPDLTLYEMRYCAFIKLNLGSKEIAQINNTTIKAAYMFRYRLKKKLKLLDEEGLDAYLSSLT
jgi:tetratricopeptide (TPR) repeat protein